MTPDELVNAFILAGFDTPQKVQAALADLNLQLQIKLIDIELDGLGPKQTEVLKPINDQRIDLNNQRAALSAQLAGQ